MQNHTAETAWTPPSNDYRDLDLSELQTIDDCDDASSLLCERAVALHDQITMVFDDDDVRHLKSHLARLHHLREEVRILKSQYWREDVDARQSDYRNAIDRKTRALEELIASPQAQEIIEAKKQAQIEVRHLYTSQLEELERRKHERKMVRIARSNEDREPFLQQLILTLKEHLGKAEQTRLCELARIALEANRGAL
jgi:hypothetical protein